MLLGWRAAVDGLTNRPVIVDLWPFALPPTVWVTLVLGFRAAAALLMNLPVLADFKTVLPI